MPRDGQKTRTHILTMATRLFYKEGIRNVSIDAVAEKAEVTKRTFYYHFRSKDDLVSAYLESKDLPSLELYQKWFDSSRGKLATKVESIFMEAAESARHPKWRGCGFLRTASELANKPGHPAIKVGAGHKKRCEDWLSAELKNGGCRRPDALAKQIILLLDGAFSTALIHRDPEYFILAGQAANSLVMSALVQ